MTPHYNNTVLIAHYANDFDNYPVINALIDHHGVVPDKILYNGSKIIYMHVAKGLDLTFRDSLNFLDMRLSKLPGCFDLNELCKGYFPHLFKGKLSTTIVILSYSKLLSFSILTFIKWRLNTESLANTQRNGPTDPLHISCICSIWKILHIYSSISLNSSKSAFFHALTLSLLPKSHMLFIVSKQCTCSRQVHIEGHMNIFEFLLSWTIIPITIVLGLFWKKNVYFAV